MEKEWRRISLIVILLVGVLYFPGVAQSASESSELNNNVSSWTLPEAKEDAFNSTKDISIAKTSGWLTKDNRIVLEDILVLKVSIPGIDSAISENNSKNLTSRFLNTTTGNDSQMILVETNPHQNERPLSIRLNQPKEVMVIQSNMSDTYYIRVDISETKGKRTSFGEYNYSDSKTKPLTDYGILGSTFSIYIDINDDGLRYKNTDDYRDAPVIKIVEPSATIHNKSDISFRPGEHQVVEAATSYAPGTKAEIILKRNLSGPTITTYQTTVKDNNSSLSSISSVRKEGFPMHYINQTIDMNESLVGEMVTIKVQVKNQSDAVTGVIKSRELNQIETSTNQYDTNASDRTDANGDGFTIFLAILSILLLILFYQFKL